ncbi:hypothetical protein CRG98_020773 [Punica granatum]|uniref:G-patch domain-containing protein n=1 Tax=Punica granatum TaxID=22663 RepID=A0A2I0JRB9_PUNGR|nr:hypothetical protein CRG98_020773 [Punica granatum]
MVQNQNMHCEFHQGAPGHTLDTCWRLQDRIQEMIDARQISFNEVKQPNVRVNPLPDHGSGPGSSINMISTCAIGEEEETQESPTPFIIEYVSAEVTVASAPFIIEVPAKEPYQDNRVPWNYGDSRNPQCIQSLAGKTLDSCGWRCSFLSTSEVEVLCRRDYGEVVPSRTDRMIGKVLLKNDYVPGTGLGARAQGIFRPIEVKDYRNRRGLGFRPSCHEIVQARRGKHLHQLVAHYGKLSRSVSVPPLSQFFPAPPQETSSGIHVHPAREDEELTNWTSVPLHSATVADV